MTKKREKKQKYDLVTKTTRMMIDKIESSAIVENTLSTRMQDEIYFENKTANLIFTWVSIFFFYFLSSQLPSKEKVHFVE